MPDPDKPVCPLCNGDEAVFINEYDKAPCKCLMVRLYKKHLGNEVSTARTILGSPLYQEEDGKVVVDRTKENLFIRSYWPVLLSHFKWTFFRKGMSFRFGPLGSNGFFLTDERILKVWLGSESYNQRPKGKRDDTPTFNSLGDLVGTDYNLVVIRLGFLGHPNRAAPGALKEALMIREVACLPTWIVEEPDNDFGKCHSFSNDVYDYIGRNFATVDLTQTGNYVPVPREVVEDVSGNEDPSQMPSITTRAPMSRSSLPYKTKEAPEVDADFFPGEGSGNKKPQWKKKGRNDGGSPI